MQSFSKALRVLVGDMTGGMGLPELARKPVGSGLLCEGRRYGPGGRTHIFAFLATFLILQLAWV